MLQLHIFGVKYFYKTAPVWNKDMVWLLAFSGGANGSGSGVIRWSTAVSMKLHVITSIQRLCSTMVFGLRSDWLPWFFLQPSTHTVVFMCVCIQNRIPSPRKHRCSTQRTLIRSNKTVNYTNKTLCTKFKSDTEWKHKVNICYFQS